MSSPAQQPRRILVSGSTGHIGSALVQARRAAGDTVVPLVRKDGPANAIHWNADGELNPEAVSGFDVVVYLAGEPVATGRWTAAKKRRILESRVQGTGRLAAALAAAPQPPKVFVCASGINFYGDRGEAVLDESAPRGSGFLADVCEQWERAADPLHPLARVVPLRIGVVLTPQGGALASMLPLFRFGLAGIIAGGSQFVSWVTLDDVVRAIGHVMDTPELVGPVNVVSPAPVTGREFTTTIAAAVHRPAVLPVPAFAARLMLGQLADETVLASVRAVPHRLLESGFRFQHPALAEALAGWHLDRR